MMNDNLLVGLSISISQLLFVIWLYIFIKSKLKKRKTQKHDEEYPEETFEMPDIELEELPQKETRNKSRGILYKDSDSHVHTDDELLQHDKGKRYRDGDRHVHTDDESLRHDKGKLYRSVDYPKDMLIPVQEEALQENAEFTEPDKSSRPRVKKFKKKLAHPKLVDNLIMGELLGRPKGLN